MPSTVDLASVTFFGGPGDQGGMEQFTSVGVGLAYADQALYLTASDGPTQGLTTDTSLIAKYTTDLSTEPVWSRVFPFGTKFHDVAATSEGVYAAASNLARTTDNVGGKEGKSLLAKFAPDATSGSGFGGTQWASRPLFFSYSGTEAYYGVTAATIGNQTILYAAGFGEPYISTLAKYDTAGNMLATATFPMAGGGAVASDVAYANANGHVYSAGVSWDPEHRPTILEYDANLNFIRQIRDLSVSGYLFATTATQDALYVVGMEEVGHGIPPNYLIQKYDLNGNRSWSTVIARPSGGSAALVDVVTVGNRLFAVGGEGLGGSAVGDGAFDAVLFEFDPATGGVLSKMLLATPQYDVFTAAVTDGTNLYVAGDSRGFASAQGNRVGQDDAILLRFTLPTFVAGTAAPIADAAGPYTVAEGAQLSLSAAGTTDANQSNLDLTYAWDLDGDGVFGETGAAATRGNETGMTPTFVATSLDGPSTFTVSLRVTDSGGLTSTDTATINIANTPPTLTISGAADIGTGTPVGSPYTLNLASSDPGFDTITSWTINWGDGTIQTLAGNPSSVTHTYSSPNYFYTVFASATDEDGTFASNQHRLGVYFSPSAPMTLLNPGVGIFSQSAPGALVPGGSDWYRINAGGGIVPGTARQLTASVAATGFNSRLSLYDRYGQLLIQSEGQSPTNLDDRIVQYLIETEYYLKVEAADGGSGSYVVTASVADTAPPFSPFLPVPVGGTTPAAVISADFNDDGVPDLATANSGSNNVSILVGGGDGTFPNFGVLTAASAPTSLVAGDFNRDGRLDLAVANSGSNNVSIFLGNGDGTFQSGTLLAVGLTPKSLVAQDFDRDGKLDLAVANSGSNSVSLFFGLGNGSFSSAAPLGAGATPVFLVAGDFNGDSRIDLAVANLASNNISVLLGNGDRTFQPQFTVAAGGSPIFLAFGDFDEDGYRDLLVANSGSANVTVLFGKSNAAFGTTGDQTTFSVGSPPQGLATGDFDQDGHLDFVAANFSSNQITSVLGNGSGGFQTGSQFFVGTGPAAIAVGDYNGDGYQDVAIANKTSNNLSVLLGFGKLPATVQTPRGWFYAVSQITNATQAKPVLADLTGDGVDDVTVLRQDGRLLFRRGRPGEPGVFDAPIIVNPVPTSGNLSLDFPARDVAAVFRNGRFELVALDAQGLGLSLYSFNPGSGTLVRAAGPALPLVLSAMARVTAGDLNGDGRGDLAVTSSNYVNDHVYVYYQQANGTFGIGPANQVVVGISPLSIELADMNGDDRPDIIVSNQFSGDVSILFNNGGSFTEQRFRAGPGAYGQGLVVQTDPWWTVESREGTVAVVAGLFNGDGLMDLVSINRVSGNASLLVGNSTGVFNPQGSLSFGIGANGTVAVAAQFNSLTATLDLAVLDQASQCIRVFSGNSSGVFTFSALVDAGNAPTGLSVADINGDAKMDLLVGNEFGDILIILGNGDGTFRPFERADQKVPFVTSDLNGDGVADVLLANQALDQAVSQLRQPGTATFTTGSFAEGRADGLIAPGAVALADLNRDGKEDYIIANSGSNNVLVYLGTGPGQFSATARSFFAGTKPVSVIVQDLNGDGAPDLVTANEGSNDATVLLGQGSGAAWTFTPGPRLDTGGAGPNNVAVRDQTGDGILDLLVTNGQAGTVSMLPGIGAGVVGTGFFNDNNPSILNVGAAIAQTLIGADGLLRTTNGSIFRFNPGNFNQAPQLAFGRLVTGMTSGAGGSLVVSRSDNTLSLLSADATGQFAESLVFVDARLDNPSALQVVGAEIYVTNAANNMPLVIGLVDGVPVLAPGFIGGQFEGGGQRGQFASIQPLSEANFALVVTLLTGSDADEGQFAGAASLDNSLVVGLGSRPVALLGANDLLELFVGIQSGTEGEESEANQASAESEGSSPWVDFVIGLQEALKRLSLEADERMNALPPPSEGESSLAMLDEVFRGCLRGRDWLRLDQDPAPLTVETRADIRPIDPRLHDLARSLAAVLADHSLDAANPNDSSQSALHVPEQAAIPTALPVGSQDGDESAAPPRIESRASRQRPWHGLLMAGLLTCGAWQTWWRDWRKDVWGMDKA